MPALVHSLIAGVCGCGCVVQVLATVEALGVERLLFIGVGCQVQALRAVQHHIGLKELYVMGEARAHSSGHAPPCAGRQHRPALWPWASPRRLTCSVTDHVCR